MSTYKRPELLNQQLHSLLRQSFKNFEVVISDNDPDASAKEVVSSFNENRFKYYHNIVNLGVIKSFNKSIERASAEYIVMITDDDPIQENFLSEIYEIYKRNGSYGIYGGFLRKKRKANEVEFIPKETFAEEILNSKKTTNILWSSCVIEKAIANKVGKLPDFGSPHLADHAFIAMAGSVKGAVIINKMYSSLTSHNTNFSKSNFEYYIKGCYGFYTMLTDHFKTDPYFANIKAAVNIHLRRWLLSNIFFLKKYYSCINKNEQIFNDVEICTEKILQLHFMRRHRAIYYLKNVIFYIKKSLNHFGLYPYKNK